MSAPDKKNRIRVISLLPNLLTIGAICAGLTAIRYGYQGEYEWAVRLILVAGILDGLDGQVARMLKSTSLIGAELDSLADFVNFGVAPVLILHAWVLNEFPRAGWAAVLTYAICCALRLARFNVGSRMKTPDSDSAFFEGVPSPAGAVLVMLPMFVAFAFPDLSLASPVIIAGYTCLVGLLMISRVPTYSFKNLWIDRSNAKFLFVGAVLIAASLFTYLWATLVLMTLVYIGSFIWALRSTDNFWKPKG